MHIKADQSKRIEEAGDTALAFTNQESFTILIPSAVKRDCFIILKRQGRSQRTAKWMLFATAVFLLVRRHLKKITKITIDMEFDRETMFNVRNRLWGHIHEVLPSFKIEQIDFASLGKGLVHDKAYKVYKGKEKADEVINSADILPLLK